MGKYDPKRRKRRTTRRRKADPRRRRRSGTIKRKPYRVGRRGGVYWSGGRKRRYDPRRRRSWRRRVSGGLKGAYNQIISKMEALSGLLGFGMFFGIPMYSSYKHAQEVNPTDWGGKNILEFIARGFISESKQLLGMEGTWKDPVGYLQWKFTNPESHWCRPWQASIGGYIGSRLIRWIGKGIIPNKALEFMRRVVEPILGLGIVATTFGGLFMFGSDSNGNKPAGNPTSNYQRYSSANARSPQSYYG